MPVDEKEALLAQIIQNPCLTLTDGEVAALLTGTDQPTATGVWAAIDAFMARLACV